MAVEVICSLVVYHLCQMGLFLVLPMPSQQDSYFFFIVMMLIDDIISILITKALTGKTNTMIAVTIYMFGMWLFGPSGGFLGIVLVLIMWVICMLIAVAS